MKRLPLPGLVLAATLALLLPLEQAHCAWMGLQASATPTAAASRAGHACCARPATSQPQEAPQPGKDCSSCVCLQIPAGAMPTAVTIGADATSAPALESIASASSIEPAASLSRAIPPLDVGSPPLPVDPGAHGLRAPPASA